MSMSLFGKLLLLLFPIISKDANCVASSFTRHMFDDLDFEGEEDESAEAENADVDEDSEDEDCPAAFRNANGKVCAGRVPLLKEGAKVLLGDFTVTLPSGFASMSFVPPIVNSSPTVRMAPSGGTITSFMRTSEDSKGMIFTLTESTHKTA